MNDSAVIDLREGTRFYILNLDTLDLIDEFPESEQHLASALCDRLTSDGVRACLYDVEITRQYKRLRQ